MNGIIFCVCSASSTCSLEVMSKRTQEDADEERVTAQSKPVMNLVSRNRVRIRTCLPQLHRKARGKTRSESQKVPLSSSNVQHPSLGRPVLGANSSNYSEWNIDDKWFSQEWKSGEIGSKEGETRRCALRTPCQVGTPRSRHQGKRATSHHLEVSSGWPPMLRALCNPSVNNIGMRGSPCSPPSPLWDVL